MKHGGKGTTVENCFKLYLSIDQRIVLFVHVVNTCIVFCSITESNKNCNLTFPKGKDAYQPLAQPK